jgi:alanine transaminase
LNDKNALIVSKLYPSDVIQRAKDITARVGAIGAYTHSKGVPYIRQKIARFIERKNRFFTIN